jgi:hypothetical protein
MNTKEALQAIGKILGVQLSEEVKLATMKLDNGAVIEAEVFEAGQDVFLVQDDERIAVPIGEYTMEDGNMLVVAEEGVISEIKAAEAPGEEVVEEDLAADYATKAELAEVKDMLTELKTLMSDLMGKEEEQLAKTEKAELAKLELAKEEKAPEFKHSPEKEADKKALNLGEQKPKSARDYIFNTINNN